MDHFIRRDKTLFAEDVALDTIAREVGTPTYVYSRATITRHVEALSAGLGGLPHHICYAVKANGNLGLLHLLSHLGVGFDAVSIGELARVRQAGCDLQQTILSGVGKRDDEIAAALAAKVLYLSAESEAEVMAIARIASERGERAAVSLRINPEVDAKTHPYISTGLATNKFGVPQSDLARLVGRIRATPALNLVGLSCHIGSQIVDLEPFADAARILHRLTADLIAAGCSLRFVGMGGGLGIPYGDEAPPTPAAYGAVLAEILGDLALTLVLEPGRVIVGNAGILLTRVVRVKDHGPRTFVLLDAGMNDLLRPSLYQARHRIEPVVARPGPTRTYEFVGPVCESADTFASGLMFSPLEPGDLVAVRSSGAYGMVMASNYNARPRAAEVLCSKQSIDIIGERETLDDLWRRERIPTI